MESHTAISGHLLLVCVPAWGHARPLCAFASKVVKDRPDVAITIVTAGELYPRMNGEIGRHFSANDADLKAKTNIRLVHIGGEGPDPLVLMPVIAQQFPSYYDKLINSQPVQCLQTKNIFDAVPKPTAVVLDFFFLPVLQHIRSVTGKRIPVLMWDTMYAAATLRLLASENYGGFGDVITKAQLEAEATGRNMEEVIDEMYRPMKGEVVTVPGMAPMYDYEWTPQEPSSAIPQKYNMFTSAYTFSNECDGLVEVSSAAFEQKSLEAMRTWLGETNRPVYAVGPLVPPGFGGSGLSETAKQMDIDSSNKGGEFQAFLDRTLKSHGTRSLIYISFGSFWWPKRNEHVWILVDALLELNFPFILSHASPYAVIPPGYLEKINQSGIGLLSTWAPQQTILNHPATGWFLTHCGQNSITESLVSGIPMIAWPLDADQPVNAAYISLSLDVAFEMVEVRTGLGLKPLYRGARPTGTVEAVAAEVRSTLQKARGPDGERKRRNAESVRDKWRGEWEEGGDALKNLRQLLTDCC